MWLSEYENVLGNATLRHNFVNQKMVAMMVDVTISLRVVICVQILALVFRCISLVYTTGTRFTVPGSRLGLVFFMPRRPV